MTKAVPEALKAWRESGAKAEILSPWEKLRKKSTRKLAIDVKCMECVGYAENGPSPENLRGNIRDCTATDCPLYDWRPYK